MLWRWFPFPDFDKTKNFKNALSMKSISSAILKCMHISSATTICSRPPTTSTLSTNTVMGVLLRVSSPRKRNSPSRRHYSSSSNYSRHFKFWTSIISCIVTWNQIIFSSTTGSSSWGILASAKTWTLLRTWPKLCWDRQSIWLLKFSRAKSILIRPIFGHWEWFFTKWFSVIALSNLTQLLILSRCWIPKVCLFQGQFPRF